MFNIFFLFLFYFIEDDLGSSEESGKDWSDLEREAAEEDKERGEYVEVYSSNKKKSRDHHSSSKDRYVEFTIHYLSFFVF